MSDESSDHCEKHAAASHCHNEAPRSEDSSGDALRGLLDLAPHRAIRIAADNSEQEIDVAKLQPGERVRVRSGERIAADGEVIDGHGAVDDSSFQASLNANASLARRSRTWQLAVEPQPTLTRSELLAIVASLETSSTHPLAGACLAQAAAEGLSLQTTSDVRSVAGRGIGGRVGGRDVLVGNRAFLRDYSIDAPPSNEDPRTELVAAIDATFAGRLVFEDTIKPTTAAAVASLRHAGLRIIMATGDRQAPALAVARSLGIEDVHAELGPDGKARLVDQLRGEGCRVAVAGDGINDAPALAVADIGIAMADGTDIAMANADLTLLRGDLAKIDTARRISRAAIRNIHQNLFFAFAYNALGIPLAAGALYPLTGQMLNPMIAGAAMSLSSVSVIMNALRLRRLRLG